MLLTRNVIDPGYSGTLVAKVQANLKTPASLVRSYRGADAISLQNIPETVRDALQTGTKPSRKFNYFDRT